MKQKIERWLIGPEDALQHIEWLAQKYLDGLMPEKVESVCEARWSAERDYSSRTDRDPVEFDLLPVGSWFVEITNDRRLSASQRYNQIFVKTSETEFFCQWGSLRGKTLKAKSGMVCGNVHYPKLGVKASEPTPYVDLIESERPIIADWDKRFAAAYGQA